MLLLKTRVLHPAFAGLVYFNRIAAKVGSRQSLLSRTVTCMPIKIVKIDAF
jgi:hypothetical protein